MNIFQGIIFGTMATYICGCTSAKFYPICSYDSEGGEVITSQASIAKFIHGVVGERNNIAFSPNDRFVMVRASSASHEKLSQVWPSAACIGKNRYDVEYQKFKGCVYMIKSALATNGIPALGNESDSLNDDSSFYCGVPLEK